MMRTFARFIRSRSVASTVLLVLLTLWGSHAALGQEKRTSKPDAKAEASGALAVGNEVVLKSFRIALDDDGRQVPSWGQKSFRIERIEGERVRISSQDKSKLGWKFGEFNATSRSISQAIDFFTAEIVREPNNFDALWSRAQLWVEGKDDDRALADYDQLIRLAPDYARSYAVRGGILVRKHRIDQALADLNKAIQLEPKDALAYLERSKAWTWQKDYRRAHADLDEAIRLFPTYGEAWRLRSRAWESEGNLDEAMKDMNAAARLAPTESHIFMLRGILRNTRKEYDKAIADFSEAIKLDPNYAGAYILRGGVWREKHDLEKQIADYSLAIKLNPKNADHLRLRGMAWSSRGMHDEAIADFNEAIRVTPTDAVTIAFRGVEWMKDAIAGRNAPDKAIADFSRAIEIDPKYSWAYSMRADARRIKHDYAGMARDLESLIQLNALDPEAHDELARLLATCKVGTNPRWKAGRSSGDPRLRVDRLEGPRAPRHAGGSPR